MRYRAAKRKRTAIHPLCFRQPDILHPSSLILHPVPVWTYILRRLLLMIPTLLGVTIVSFCIMQLAPGDPLLLKAGRTGVSGQTSQTREAYLIQKRDLNLDKPLVLNFDYFRDYASRSAWPPIIMAMSEEEIAAELRGWPPARTPNLLARRRFLENAPHAAVRPAAGRSRAACGAGQADRRATCRSIARTRGLHGAAGGRGHPRARRRRACGEQIGAIRAWTAWCPSRSSTPIRRNPAEAETPAIWPRGRRGGSGQRRSFRRWDRSAWPWCRRAVRRPWRRSLRGRSSWKASAISSTATPASLPRSSWATSSSSREGRGGAGAAATGRHAVDDRRGPRDPPRSWSSRGRELAGLVRGPARAVPAGAARKLWDIVADTQYAHMVVRAGHLPFRPLGGRRPASRCCEKIWKAVLVPPRSCSSPRLLIYLVAVPLGIFCAVRRGGGPTAAISLGLFLLYSVPPFVAGMLFLLFFCYGDYLRWFPR